MRDRLVPRLISSELEGWNAPLVVKTYTRVTVSLFPEYVNMFPTFSCLSVCLSVRPPLSENLYLYSVWSVNFSSLLYFLLHSINAFIYYWSEVILFLLKYFSIFVARDHFTLLFVYGEKFTNEYFTRKY